MLNKKILVPLIAAVLVALGVNLEQFGIDLKALSTGAGSASSQPLPANRNEEISSATTAYQSGKKWSGTSPAINLHHVFEGEINRSGKPVGYHSRPGGRDPDGARLVNIKDGPNRLGVYTADIEIRDGSGWKRKFSSFFPDNMSADEVTQAVLHAYKSSNNPKKQPWRGPSGYGFDVQGYTLSGGDINTAFPIFQRDR